MIYKAAVSLKVDAAAFANLSGKLTQNYRRKNKPKKSQELPICILCYPSSHRISYKIVYEYKENAKSLVNLGKNIFFTDVYFDKKTKTVYI